MSSGSLDQAENPERLVEKDANREGMRIASKFRDHSQSRDAEGRLESSRAALKVNVEPARATRTLDRESRMTKPDRGSRAGASPQGAHIAETCAGRGVSRIAVRPKEVALLALQLQLRYLTEAFSSHSKSAHRKKTFEKFSTRQNILC